MSDERLTDAEIDTLVEFAKPGSVVWEYAFAIRQLRADLAARMTENALLQERVAAEDAILSQADKIAKENLAIAKDTYAKLCDYMKRLNG